MSNHIIFNKSQRVSASSHLCYVLIRKTTNTIFWKNFSLTTNWHTQCQHVTTRYLLKLLRVHFRKTLFLNRAVTVNRKYNIWTHYFQQISFIVINDINDKCPSEKGANYIFWKLKLDNGLPFSLLARKHKICRDIKFHCDFLKPVFWYYLLIVLLMSVCVEVGRCGCLCRCVCVCVSTR